MTGIPRADALRRADDAVLTWHRGNPLKLRDYIADAIQEAAAPTPKTAGLTKLQAEAVLFIHRFAVENGYGPSMADMRDGMGMSSKSNAHRLVNALEERGAVVRLPGKARSVAVTQ